MADITRLSRFVGGLPRDVDLTTNTLQVESLKVGTTSPAELTKSMTTLLATIDTTGLPANKMSPAAMQSTLESKLAAMRIGVLNFTPTTGNTSDTVTTQVLGGAAVDTPIGAGAGIGSASAKGIFVGTVSGASDIGKVLIRVHGTDNGFDDGTGDEIYGVLSETTGVYTLSYKTAAGAAYTILAPDTASKFDFYFIEVMDLYSFGVDRLLMPAIGGVVDATTASSVYTEHTARANADSTLQNNIDAEETARIGADDAEITARSEADSTLQNSIGAEETARINADSTLTTNLNSEITARTNADSTLTTNLNSEITARTNADSTLTTNLNSEITARQNADSTIQSSIQSAVDVETTARQDADSTLQSTLQGNIDGEVTARQDADSTLQSTLQGNIDGEVTARQDADSTLQSTLQGNIDGEVTARQDADSTLQSTLQGNIDSEITARTNADSTLTTNLNSEITARTNADSTLTTNLNSEITARLNADSSLQSELDATQGSLGSAIDGDGAWVGFSGTTYLDAELTFTAAFEALDSQLASITSSAVDVSFVAATGGISAGDVVALSLATGGVVIKADATGIATCESVVGVALETKAAGLPVLVRTLGDATVTTDGTNFDLGKRVYAHTVAGQASKTAPSTVNNVVYLLGGATATNKVFVNTNLEYVVT